MKPREKTGESNLWLTPQKALDPIRAYFGGFIPLDPCNEPHNPTQARHFFTEKQDGLTQDWSGYDGWFVNPPYSLTPEMRARRVNKPPFQTWCAKIKDAASASQEPGIALLPCGARFSTRYFQDSILDASNAVCFVRGRLKFIDGATGTERSGQNNYDSAIWGFNVNPKHFADCFWELGTCLELVRR
jgi:phage N-6-adenine-methyltransferase